MTEAALSRKARRSKSYSYIKAKGLLYLMLLLPISYYIIFKYIPMFGVMVAFKNYSFIKGILGSPWGGDQVF